MRRYCIFLLVFYQILLTYHNVCGQNSEQFLFVTKDTDIFTRKPRSVINNLSLKNFISDEDDKISSILERSKRDTKNSIPFSLDNSQGKNISTIVNRLNDSHAQLMVHWLGEGTDVIICLAREPPLGILDDPKKATPPSPSSVFLSFDYGDTFADKSDLFNLTINGTSIRSTVDEFITHLKFNTIVFTDARNKAIFSSSDYGRTFQSSLLDFKPSDVTFYEQDSKTFLALDKEDPERKLYYTTDLGKSFNLLQSRVKSFVWSSIEGYPVHLYVERTEPTNTSSIIFLDAADLVGFKQGTKNKFNLLIENVQEFFIKKDFMFATQKILDDTKVLISYRRGRFVKATFQTELDIKGIHVADVEGKRILLSVMHTEKISHLYVSESNADMSEIKFVPSLENIFSYLPNQNWRSSWLVQTSDEAFTDLYKVEGLQGIYIASKIAKMPAGELISPDHLVSVITFDHGSTWRPIHAPTVDDEGVKIQNCKDCSLHLSQKFSQLYPVTRSVSIMSSKSAPGVILASGVIGKSLKGHPGVFISRDAGLTWKQILKNYYFFNMGDHGGVLVAVKYFKSKGETNEILYSTDEGETWIPHPFHANDLKVYGLMTEPNTNTTIFTLFGSEVSEHKWLIIKIDLKNAFTANCTEDDYKFWAPGLYSDGSLMPCLLGQRLTYQRRKPHAQCHNGLNYERPFKTEVCGCNKWDFECDFGFTRTSRSSHCVRNKTIPNFDPFEPPKSCKPGKFYNRTKGYRKIEGDVCIEGFANPFLPQEIPCPIKFDKEFLIVAQRDKISSIDLSTNSAEILPIKGVKNVIAVDFDRKHNCVFWADILSDTIGRQCLNGNESAEILVETGLGSVEGMSYDWVSELLYFVDGLRLRIEAVYVGNTTSHGRFRKTIVSNLAKPRGIVVHPIQGYIFWTDWSSTKPTVSRSNMDGTDVRELFKKPDVVWPNGITVDYFSDRIYWVDASKDYIASSDLNGGNFHIVMQQDPRVGHPFAIAIYKDLMYWDDWKMNSVFQADKDQGIMIQTITHNMQHLMDLKLFGHSIQEGTNACSNGKHNCAHACVAAPGGKFSCLCPDGMVQNGNGECLCPGSLKPFGNNTCPQAANTCAPGYFTCKNRICVPNTYKCDGEDDCGDRSDEEGCASNKPPCPPHMFACKTVDKCIPDYFVCDYDSDCPDNSDEQNCKVPECKRYEFKCNNGRCISNKWVCDGEDDCRDGSDEKCEEKSSVTCKPDEFKCNSTGSCIPDQWRCDLDNDCQDGSDEMYCRNKTCDAWMFRCGDGLCIYKTWQCDGENDCADQSDEKNCSNLIPPKSSSKTPPPLPDDTCHDWMFKCANQKCIPYWWKCDTVNDCGDNSDEIGCDANITTPATNSVTTTTEKSSINRPRCRPNEFACDSGTCISMRYVCDNYTDCAHGEDEKACPQNQQCSPGEFRCLSDGLCLPLSKYCDKVINCADGSDENCQFPVYPAKNNNCENNPGMFICDDTCLPLMKKCDGKVDCIITGEDEDKQMCSKFQRVYQVIQIGVDERTLNATSFLIYWWIPVPANITFEYLPSIYVNGQWQNHTSWIETATDYRFTKLMPYTVYNVTVYVRIKGTKSVFPPHLFYEVATSEGIPTVPLNVSVIQINGSRVQVSWSPPKSINGHLEDYFIFYRAQVAKTSMAASTRVGALENSTIIESEFKDGVVYEFWVKVKNRRFSSAPSEHVTLKFDGTANIDAISGLKILNQKDDTITITWDKVKKAEGYILQPILPQPYPRVEPIKTKDTRVTIHKLVPGVQYVLKVSAYVKRYVGRPQTLIFTIPKIDPLPVIRNVNVTKVGDTIKVTWDKATHSSYTNLVYGIYYGTNLDELAEKPRQKTTNTNIEIKNMKPCESYLVSVNVIEPIGPGPLSDPKTIATGFKLTEPPRNLQVDIKGHDMIITWEPSCPLLTNANLVEYMITIREHILNKTNHVTVQPTPNRTLVHNFTGIPKGSHYTVTVAINTDKAQPAVAQVSADPLPAPTQLRVWPERNGSYSVHWKDIDFHDEKHKYETVVFEGMGINGTQVAVIEAKEAPVQIHQSHLGGATAAGKVFTVGVRMKTERGFLSNIENIEYISVQPDGLQSDSLKESGSSWWWVTLICILLASFSGIVFFLVQRHRRLQSSFSRFVNGHYDTKTGATRFFEDEHEHHHETATTFADDEPLVVT